MQMIRAGDPKKNCILLFANSFMPYIKCTLFTVLHDNVMSQMHTTDATINKNFQLDRIINNDIYIIIFHIYISILSKL